MKLKIMNDDQEHELEEGAELSKALNAVNSPILFGCRTGICGTCLVEVMDGSELDKKSNEDEKELLDIISDGQAPYRLACQMRMNNDCTLKYIGKK
jgi:ferredoxin